MRFLLAALVVAGCVQQRSERCKHVCAREYECVTQTSNPIFDEKECVAACSELEADQQNLVKLQQHADCVAKPMCADVLECRY